MVSPVQNGASEVVEAGIEQIERVPAHLLDGANLADEVSAFGDQIAAGLDFQGQLVAELVFEAFTAGVPQLEVAIEIDVRLAFAIGSRQATAGADRGYGTPNLGR